MASDYDFGELLEALRHGHIDRRDFILGAVALGVSTSAAGVLLDAHGTDASTVYKGKKALVTKVPLKKRPGDKKVKIAFDLPSQAQLRWRFDQKYFQQAVHELGDSVVFQNANDSESTQSSQVENLLAQSPDVLVLAPVNVKSAATLADQATKQGTRVISYNYMIQDTTNIAFWVARSNVAVGRMTAQLAIKAKPKGNYVLVGGDPGTDVAQDKTKGYISALQPHVKTGAIKIVSKQFNNAWDPSLGQRQIENALTATNNNIAAILCNYDGFAVAALQALKGTGLLGKVWIGGEDVFPQGAQAIVDGQMAMSAYTDLLQMARLAAQAAHDLGNARHPKTNTSVNNGAGSIRGYRVNSFAVTKKNMCVFIKETNWITYKATYVNSKRPVC